jgi:outer membrane protein TolC
MYFSEKMMTVWSFVLLCCCVMSLALYAEVAAAEHELVEFIRTATRQSDAALDIRDSIELSRLDTGIAEHEFDTVVVPLTTIGFTEGTGTQQLGVELRKEIETGTEFTYGVVGNRLEENSDYVIDNLNSARAFVKISQGLFRRWGTKYNLTALDVAKLRSNLNEITAQQTLQVLILETTRKYYALLLADLLLGKSTQALERSKENLNSAVSRQSVGLVSKVDVYRAELAALAAENSLQSQVRERQRAFEDFREQLRVAGDGALRWHESLDKIVPVLPESWEETVLDNRMEWQAYLMNSQVLQREMYKVKRDLLPDVGLSLTVEQRGEGDTIEQAAELDETNWSFQLQVNSTFNTFAEDTAMTRKKIEITKLRREGDALQRKIFREVRDGLADLQMAERQHQVNRRQLEQAEMAIDLARIRYEKGLSDNLDMLDAESAYADAEMAVSRSLVAYNNAAVHLAYVMGILNIDWIAMSVR